MGPVAWFVRGTVAVERRLEAQYAKLGRAVGTRPLRFIAVAALLFVACTFGFSRFETESKGDRLWVAQDSEPIEHRDWIVSQPVFGARPRIERIIFRTRGGGSALTVAGVRALFGVLDAARAIEPYEELCYRLTGADGQPGACALKDSVAQFWGGDSAVFEAAVAAGNVTDASLAALRGATQMPDGTPATEAILYGGLLPGGGAQMLYSELVLVGADAEEDAAMSWEARLIDELESLAPGLADAGYAVAYLAQRSVDDELARSVSGDVPLVLGTYLAMTVFLCFALGSLSGYRTRAGMAGLGVLSILIGAFCGYGVASGLGVPFTSLVQALVFLLVGIGADDLLVMTFAYDATPEHLDVSDRMERAFRNGGMAITVTTATNCAAFALGTLSSVPAVSWFCAYASLALLFIFVFALVLYMPLLVLDERRRRAGRLDCLCCFSTRAAKAAAVKHAEASRAVRPHHCRMSSASTLVDGGDDALRLDVLRGSRNASPSPAAAPAAAAKTAAQTGEEPVAAEAAAAAATSASAPTTPRLVLQWGSPRRKGRSKGGAGKRSRTPRGTGSPRRKARRRKRRKRPASAGAARSEADAGDLARSGAESDDGGDAASVGARSDFGDASRFVDTGDEVISLPAARGMAAPVPVRSHAAAPAAAAATTAATAAAAPGGSSGTVYRPSDGTPDGLSRTGRFLRDKYGRAILSPAGRVVVLVFFAALLAAAVHGTMNIKLGFKTVDVVPDDSYVRDFFETRDEFFEEQGIRSELYFRGVDTHTPRAQKLIVDFLGDAESNAKVEGGTFCYLPLLIDFYRSSPAYNASLDADGYLGDAALFRQALEEFVLRPDSAAFAGDLQWSGAGASRALDSSRCYAVLEAATEANSRLDLLLSVRATARAAEINDGTTSPDQRAFFFHSFFIFYQQFEGLIAGFVLNFVYVGFAVLVICSVMLLHPGAVLIVVAVLALVDVYLMGSLYYWDLDVNNVVGINLIASAGLTVDFLSHITHAFVREDGGDRRTRAAAALGSIGAPVLYGGFTTLIGVVPLSLAKAPVFRVFFKVMLSIVFAGVLCGIVLLPVVLSLVGPSVSRGNDRGEALRGVRTGSVSAGGSAAKSVGSDDDAAGVDTTEEVSGDAASQA